MINAIIVDDEPYCCETLELLLGRYCPEVNVMAICDSGEAALNAIAAHQPQLVFLDIEMPRMNGFEMLERVPVADFALIFTTSYDHYAIKAIRFSALDYLLKPIDHMELRQAIMKVAQQRPNGIARQLELLLKKMSQPDNFRKKMALPTMEGLQMIDISSIIFCSADGNYTYFITKSKLKITVSRTLKDVEELLEEYGFVRVHHSYLVNLDEIIKYVRGEGGYLIMSDGSAVNVSRSRKDALIKKLEGTRL